MFSIGAAFGLGLQHMSSFVKKLAGETAVYGISNILGRFLNFLLVPLYTKTLTDPADYGVVSVMFSYASLIAVFLTFGMETAFFNFSRKYEQNRVFGSAAGAVLGVSVVFFTLTAFFAEPVSNFIGYPGHADYILAFAGILALDAACSIPFARLRAQNRAMRFAAVKLINIGINILLNLYFLVACPYLQSRGYSSLVPAGYGASQFPLYIFISNLLASASSLILLLPSVRLIPLVPEKELIREMLKYAWPLILVGTAGMINETFDRLLLKYLLPDTIGDREAGVYSAFYKLSLVITIAVQAFRYAAEPFFFSHADREDSKQIYADVFRYFSYAMAAAYLVTMILLPWLAPLLIRKTSYFLDGKGLSIVPILLLANICLGLYYNVSVWYRLTGKTGIGAAISVAGAFLTLSLNFFLIPKIGYVGSAWATLITYAFMLFAGFVSGARRYPVPYRPWVTVAIVAIAVLLGYLNTSGLNWISENPGLSVRILTGALSTLLFVFAVYFTEKRVKIG